MVPWPMIFWITLGIAPDAIQDARARGAFLVESEWVEQLDV